MGIGIVKKVKIVIFFLLIIYVFSHYCGDIAKLLKVFEGDMEEIDFLDLDNFMKIEYCDLISLKLEKMKVTF